MPNFPRQIAETDEATGLIENAKASKKGGKIAKDARLKLEEQTGKKVAWVKLYKFTEQLYTDWPDLVNKINEEKKSV